MDRLKDKVALVTGSSRGIGAAIAALFVREGAKVALHGRDTQALSAVLAGIAQAGGQASYVTGDTTKFSDIEAMRRRIEREFGPVDILVANAGGSFTTPGPIEQTSEEEWRVTIKSFL
jgi:3-oxoacyl-[acyl-carrier protein] reductase